MIDFCEIPQANTGTGLQDSFELFCRDFLQCMGYEIIQHPSRGADGGMDLIVSENLNGIAHAESIKWLVSCKHTAHSRKSVSVLNELDILDRVSSFNCTGFIGMYSLIASAHLSEKLQKLSGQIKYILFDCKRIENELINNPKMLTLFRLNFPKSFKKYQRQNPLYLSTNTSKLSKLDNECLFKKIKAAVIVVEMEKIIHKYDKRNWLQVEKAFSELYIFCNSIYPEVSTTVINYLYSISNWTRSEMPLNIASGINDLASTYLPVYYGDNMNENEIFLLERSIDTGFNLAYYSFRYLNRLNIASEGLMLVKYSYTICKQYKLKHLLAKINTEYTMLDMTLTDSHWSDSEKSIASELLLAFKNDLKTPSLKLPVLSAGLYKIYSQEPDA